MKRAIIATLILATSFLVGVPAAQADMRCDTKKWTTYLGIDGDNLRYARMETELRGCWNAKTGQIIRRETDMKARIYPNGTSSLFGVEWHIDDDFTRIPYGEYQIPYNAYSDKGYFHGFFRFCKEVRGIKVCAPYNADFTIIFTFHAPKVAGLPDHKMFTMFRRAGEPFKDPGNYDKNIKFYNTP